MYLDRYIVQPVFEYPYYADVSAVKIAGMSVDLDEDVSDSTADIVINVRHWGLKVAIALNLFSRHRRHVDIHSYLKRIKDE